MLVGAGPTRDNGTMSEPDPTGGLPDAGRYDDRIDISDEDDDFEYEVEPVDEEVLAREKARARLEVARAENAVNVDTVYQELNAPTDLDGLVGEIKVRFSVRTLLIATTVIAILLGLAGSSLFSGAGFAGLICLSLFGLGSAHMWLNFRERQRREAAIAKRERQLAIAKRLAEEPNWIPTDEDRAVEEEQQLSNPIEDLLSIFSRAPRFSLIEMMIGMTLAVVIVVVLQLTGSPAGGAVALGVLSITVFAMQAADMDVPRPLLIAWWLSLVGYCSLTLVWALIG